MSPQTLESGGSLRLDPSHPEKSDEVVLESFLSLADGLSRNREAVAVDSLGRESEEIERGAFNNTAS